MTLSMIVPSLAMVALLAASIIEDGGALLMLEHAVMLPAMFVGMTAPARLRLERNLIP